MANGSQTEEASTDDRDGSNDRLPAENGRIGRRSFVAAVGGVLTTSLFASGATGATGDGSERDGGSRVEQSGGDDGAATGSDIAMGGGEGYENTVPESEATTVVASADELASALGEAGSGDVVYVAGDAEIDLGSSQLTIPGGVTLASNRGIDGAAGGHLTTDEKGVWPSFEVESGARVTGLRLGGPHEEYVEHSDDAGMGFQCSGTVEVDNCEVHGFSHAAVRVEADSTVHHCDVHHNPMDGLGYGVLVKGGSPTIEYCTFNANRHSVASDGNGGYTVRHSHFGPVAHDHAIDVHKPGGTTMEIYNNTIEAVEESDEDTTVPAVTIRGVPDEGARIEDNWFHNPKEPRESPDDWTHEAIVQAHVDSWRNVDFAGNAYGSTEPADDVGCPR